MPEQHAEGIEREWSPSRTTEVLAYAASNRGKNTWTNNKPLKELGSSQIGISTLQDT